MPKNPAVDGALERMEDHPSTNTKENRLENGWSDWSDAWADKGWGDWEDQSDGPRK